MASIRLDVVTPERSVAKDLEVESVILPGTNGQMNILPNHVNIATSLQPGSFAYLVNGQWNWALLSGGFAQLSGGKMVVLAETLELAKEIDLARAELSLKHANDELKILVAGSGSYLAAMGKKARAEARIRFVKEKGSH